MRQMDPEHFYGAPQYYRSTRITNGGLVFGLILEQLYGLIIMYRWGWGDSR